MGLLKAFVLVLCAIQLAGAYPFQCNGRIGQFANPNDPYSFFKCDSSGRAHIFHCARGTRYDRRTQICDWEDKVIGRSQKSQGGYVDGTWDNYENNNHGYNCNCYQCRAARQNNQYDCGYQRNGRCNHPPGYHGDNSVKSGSNRNRMDCSSPSQYGPKLYQNPDDCTTYYTCNMGYPVLTYCPRGLNFNPRRGGCDDTIQLGCKVRTDYQQGGGAVYEYRRSMAEPKEKKALKL